VNEADLAILKAERLHAQIRYESRRFTLQVIAALIAAFALGFAVGHWWSHA
jgi:hypothetical protein